MVLLLEYKLGYLCTDLFALLGKVSIYFKTESCHTWDSVIQQLEYCGPCGWLSSHLLRILWGPPVGAGGLR